MTQPYFLFHSKDRSLRAKIQIPIGNLKDWPVSWLVLSSGLLGKAARNEMASEIEGQAATWDSFAGKIG